MKNELAYYQSLECPGEIRLRLRVVQTILLNWQKKKISRVAFHEGSALYQHPSAQDVHAPPVTSHGY